MCIAGAGALTQLNNKNLPVLDSINRFRLAAPVGATQRSRAPSIHGKSAQVI